MKLYDFPWGVYPRRVQIYLKEKGRTLSTEDFFPGSPGWPPQALLDVNPAGKLPVLLTDEGVAITQSLGILAYLEAVFADPPMTGSTLLEKGRVAELIQLADEATTAFGFWARSVSPLFAGRGPQSLDAARVAAEQYARVLAEIDGNLEADQPFLIGDRPTIADCVLMPVLQFSSEFYGVALPDAFPKLRGWFDSFWARDSVAKHTYPPELHAVARGLEAQSGFALTDVTERQEARLT